MKKSCLILSFSVLLSLCTEIKAQNVAITDSTGYNANSSAMLDVCSFTKGLLIPRADTANISNPAKGLLVCDTTGSEVIFYFYDGSRWIDIATSGGGTDSIWVENLTDSIVYLRNSYNKLGIGIDTPIAKLDVMGDTVFNVADTVPLFVVRDKDGKEVFVVYPKGVFIFVDTLSSSTKATTNDQPTGFRVGKKTIGSTKDFDEEYFSVLPATVADTIDPSEARVLWYPKKEAFMAGRVLVEGVDSVGTNSWASGYESKSIGNYSQALGFQAIARGHYSTAIGYDAVADGDYSFALGDSTWAGGGGGAKGTADNCYALGKKSEATGDGSYAFGRNAYSNGEGSFAVGDSTMATSKNSFAFGRYTQALGKSSFAMGDSAIAGTDTTEYAFVFGRASKATGGNSFAFGKSSTASGDGSYALGKSSMASNVNSFAFGFQAKSSGQNAFAFGNLAEAYGDNSYALGDLSKTLKSNSYSLGSFAQANGFASYAIGDSVIAGTDTTGNAYAFGKGSKASGDLSYAFGFESVASGPQSFALGERDSATGPYSYALGVETKATNENSFAMGAYSIANGSSAFALGHRCLAEGERSLAVGDDSKAYENSSVALGKASEAHEKYSFAVGREAIALGEGSVAIGSYATALSNYSYAIGYNTVADSSYSVSIGRSNHARGWYSQVFGNSNIAYSAYETVVGRGCESYTPNSKTSWNSSDRLFVIGNSDGTSYTNAMTVLKNGNVGIGISTPIALLHVNGSLRTNSDVRFENVPITGIDSKILTIDSQGNLSYRNAGMWATGSSSVVTTTGGQAYYLPKWSGAFVLGNSIIYDNSLRVGINTNQPTQTLDVNGSARVRSIGSGTYVGAVNRTSDGTLISSTSDARLKENIEPLQSSLDKVMKLQGVSFTWKKNPEMGTKIGFIAQEVKEVLPELVFTNPTDGYYGINYAEMSAVLVEALKEQQQLILQLQKENKEFRAALEKINMQGKNVQKEGIKINSEKRNVINK